MTALPDDCDEPSQPPERRDPDWFKRAVFYEVLVRGFADSNGDGTGDLRGLTDKLDYLQWLGIDCLWLPPFYPLAAARRRLRRQRLHRRAARVRHRRRLQALPRRGARARHPRDRRLRHEPHVRPAPVVPGQPQRPGRAVRRLLRVERRRHALPRRAHHLRRHRAVQLDVRPGAQAVLLAPLLQPPARPELRLPRRAAGDPRRAAVLARPRHRRVPPRRRALPVRARRHERREPARDARVPQAGAQGGRPRLPRPRAAVRGQPVAGRRGRVLRRPVQSAATSATWRSTSR